MPFVSSKENGDEKNVAETTRIFHAPDYRLFIIKLHSEKT